MIRSVEIDYLAWGIVRAQQSVVEGALRDVSSGLTLSVLYEPEQSASRRVNP